MKYCLGITSSKVNIAAEYCNILKKFLDIDTAEKAISVKMQTGNIMEKYFRLLDSKNIKEGTFNNMLQAITHFFDYLKVQDIIQKVPYHVEYYLKKEIYTHHNRSINEDVYMEMIHKLPLFPEKPRLVFLHLWALGLRCNEVCTLKGNAYYMQGRDAWIQVYQYKMKNYKKVPIPLALYKLMKVYIRKNGILPEEYVFQNSTGGAYLYGTFRKQMMKYCGKYGIGDGTYQFKSHDYRHTLATMFYDNGTSIQSVRDYLGHDFEEMTQQYIDYMPKKISKANKEYLSKEENSLAAGIKRCKRGK